MKTNKKNKPKSKHKVFISNEEIYNIDNYILSQIDYVINWTISDADKVDIIKWLLKWYPNATLNLNTINQLLSVACDKHTKYIDFYTPHI